MGKRTRLPVGSLAPEKTGVTLFLAIKLLLPLPVLRERVGVRVPDYVRKKALTPALPEYRERE
jgi:hypothetical protein